MGQFVVGDDLREHSQLPLNVGASWAKSFGKKLVLLHGEPLAGSEALDMILNQYDIGLQEKYTEAVLEANNSAMEEQVASLSGIDRVEIECESRVGGASDVLLEQGKNSETDLIILGYTPERSLKEVFLGTVAEELIHKSAASIMIVKNDDVTQPKNIMVAYDFSHHCDQALDWAKLIFQKVGAKVHLVNVVPCYYQGYRNAQTASGELNRKIEEMVTENIHEFEEKLLNKGEELKREGIDASSSLLLDKAGSISDRLSEYIDQENIDLALMGSHMRGKIKELFLGSVAAALIKKSKASILVAK